MKRLLILITFIFAMSSVSVLTGCSNKERIEIECEESGYNLYRYLDSDRDIVLNAVKDTIGQPEEGGQLEDKGCIKQGYMGLTESKYGMQFHLSLVFAKESDAKKYVFAAYYNKAQFDHWLDKDEKESLQKVFDEMVSMFGEPDHLQYIFDITDVFGDDWKHSRYAEWTDDHAGISFEFDQPTHTGYVTIHYENSQFVAEHEEVFGYYVPKNDPTRDYIHELINEDRDEVLSHFDEKEIEYALIDSSNRASDYDLYYYPFGDYTTVDHLMFAEYGGTKGQRLYQYYVKAEDRFWPDEEEVLYDPIIDLYEYLLEEFGDPDQVSPTMHEAETLLSVPADREAVWELKAKDLRIRFHIYGNQKSFTAELVYESISGCNEMQKQQNEG